jgi:hypothetical protein
MGVHIGSRIKLHCEMNHIPVPALCNLTGMEKSSIYRIFSKANLDTGTLLKFSIVLKHNFFQYFWEEKTKTSDTEILQLKEELSQLKQELDKLRQEHEETKRQNEMLQRENKLLNKFLDKMKPA